MLPEGFKIKIIFRIKRTALPKKEMNNEFIGSQIFLVTYYYSFITFSYFKQVHLLRGSKSFSGMNLFLRENKKMEKQIQLKHFLWHWRKIGEVEKFKFYFSVVSNN